MDNLKYIRKKKGLSQVQVAVAIGVTQQEISRIEKGDLKKINMEILENLAFYYGMCLPKLVRIICKCKCKIECEGEIKIRKE